MPRRDVRHACADARGCHFGLWSTDRLQSRSSGECGEERREHCDQDDQAAQGAQTSLDSRALARFDGKNGLVLGVANRRSIAWAIAKRLTDEGATLAFTFQGERIEKNVRELAESVDSPLVTGCDVREDGDLERVFGEVGEAFGGQLDLLVHSVAFATPITL